MKWIFPTDEKIRLDDPEMKKIDFHTIVTLFQLILMAVPTRPEGVFHVGMY
jgi:hypothetical protein